MTAQSSSSVECAVPPPGWLCTRRAGHDGPCAAMPELVGLVSWRAYCNRCRRVVFRWHRHRRSS